MRDCLHQSTHNQSAYIKASKIGAKYIILPLQITANENPTPSHPPSTHLCCEQRTSTELKHCLLNPQTAYAGLKEISYVLGNPKECAVYQT